MRTLFYTGILSLLLMLTSCENYHGQQESPLRYIPEDAPVILKTNDFLSLWTTYSKSSWWALRDENPGFAKVYNEMMQLHQLAGKNEKIKNTFFGNTTYVAVSVDNEYKASLLLTANTSLTPEDLEQMIRQQYSSSASVTRETYLENPLYRIIFSERDDILYFTIRNGVLLLSYELPVMKRAFQQYVMKRGVQDLDGFRKAQKTAGQYSDGTLYLNFNKLPNLLLGGSYSGYGGIIKQLGGLAGWSALDLSAKQDKLVLNGFTEADSAKHLQGFRSEAGSLPMQSITPSSAAVVLAQNYNSGASCYHHLKQKGNAKAISAKYDVERHFFNWFTGKSLLIIDGGTLNNISDKTTAIFLADDADEALRGIEQMAAATGESYYDKTGDDSKRVIRLPSSTLMPTLFGDLYQNLTSPYFTVHNNMVLASANLNHLLESLRKIENNDVIAQDDTYQSLAPGLTGSSNMMLYINMSRALPLATGINSKLKDAVNNNTTAWEQISGLTAEFSYQDGLYFTSIYASSGEALRSEKESSWEITLDAKVVGQPRIVRDHLSAEKRIIAFDALNNMYFISHDGEILWKHTLSGRPLGEVHQVDAYSNNKVQYLLNTENHIYMIDVLGRDVGDFPVKLPAKATNGIAVFSYNDYRLVYAGSDQKIYSYDIEGKQVSGWSKPSVPGKVTTPLQHHAYSGRDYIFAQTENGKVMILNRRGEPRVNIEGPLVSSANSAIYVNKTNSKAPFITTEISGALKYIKLNGNTGETSFDQFSNDHHFFYERFNEDRHYDFIYFDKGNMVVYDRFKNVLYKHRFGDAVYSDPGVTVFDKATAIKLTSLSAEECILVTSEGVNETVTGLKTTTPFDIGKLKQYGKTTVIAGDGSKLVKYIL